MKQIFFIVVSILFFSSCAVKKEWQQADKIDLGDVTPIGFAFQNDKFWIADGDHNQVVAVNSSGEIQEKIADSERPMHIDIENGVLYIPEYGSDQIIEYHNNEKSVLEIPDSLDAPAGVDVYQKEIAIADFYNHRIVYFNGQSWTSFGKKGKKVGELYYPTDVQILSDKIVVADAYNNRIQVFDKDGNALQTIGESEKMNAATGIFANEKEIWVTDFENDRVLVFDYNGNLQQIINEGLEKPTEILKVGDAIYIANYKGKNILKFQYN